MTQQHEEIPDFTSSRAAHKFRIDDDIFEAIPELPAGVALDFAARAQQIGATRDAEEQGTMIREFIKAVLTPATAEQFLKRLNPATNPETQHLKPIGISQVMQIMQWSLGKYTDGVPTEQSSAFYAGASNQVDGMNSMDNIPAVVLTSAGSPSTGS